ncbi:MAG: site-2 protease family protein [Gemmatimonadaceae bacterium]
MTPKAIQLLLGAPVLLFAMVAHEYAHGYAAHKQGDDTAKLLGRLSWNPLRHIDPWMTIILPAVMFYTTGMALGGAKPVPVDPRNYRNYRSGDIIVSLAGIATNLAIAALMVPAIIGLGLLGRAVPATSDTISLVQVMFRLGIFINLLLAVFNLMPLPPLDGSHVIKHFLPVRWALRYQQVARYGFLILILLLMFGGPVLRAWMAPAIWLDRLAVNVVTPYILLTPWTT